MTTHRLINWLLAAAIAVAMSSAYLLDGPNVISAEQAHYMSLVDSKREAARTVRRDLAAAALCREQHGEATYTWTAAEQLVCIPRKGKYKTKGVIMAQAVQP
jgi:hypothetical protein